MHLTCELIVMRDKFKGIARPLDVLAVHLMPILERCGARGVNSQNQHDSGSPYVIFMRIK